MCRDEKDIFQCKNDWVAVDKYRVMVLNGEVTIRKACYRYRKWPPSVGVPGSPCPQVLLVWWTQTQTQTNSSPLLLPPSLPLSNQTSTPSSKPQNGSTMSGRRGEVTSSSCWWATRRTWQTKGRRAGSALRSPRPRGEPWREGLRKCILMKLLIVTAGWLRVRPQWSPPNNGSLRGCLSGDLWGEH